MTQAEVARVVAVGASNLTRGFQTVVAAAREAWGADIDVIAALGHGRSYASSSTFLVRTLPGILHCGLWRELESRPRIPTRALITDVGNDIMFGSPPAQIVSWVDECVTRFQRHGQDIVVTSLPPAASSGLSPNMFLLFRSVFFPWCRMSVEQTMDAARQVDAGLEALTVTRGIRFCRLRPEWYSVDPIHIRPGMWRSAWQEILGGGIVGRPAGRGAAWEALRLYCLMPERVSILGAERRTLQRGVALRAGGRVWLY